MVLPISPPPVEAANVGPAVRDGLEEAARLAGAELVARLGRTRTVSLKARTDLVTDADQASEAIILDVLARRFPDATVLAEESGRHDGRAGGLRITVDPLDGTTNYAHGVPLFSVTLAASDGDGLLAGVVFDPMRGELFSATRGGGAFLDGRRLAVGHASTLEEALVATGFPYDWTDRAEATLRAFGEVARRVRGMRRFGSAAIDLAWTAAGRFDAYFERGLKPWDVSAGVLLVREAGGVVTDYAGGPPDLGHGEVVATNAALSPALLALVASGR